MLRTKKLCSYYSSPRGCRKGDQCHFQHVGNGRDTSLSPPPGRSASTQSGAQKPNGLPPLPSQPPRGVCNFYWNTGQCRHEFGCRFRHEIKTEITGNSGATLDRTLGNSVRAAPPTVDAVAPFLTDAGLAKITGNATDNLFSQEDVSSLSPTEAHSRIKRFLLDNFRFKTTFDIYGFLGPLISANTSNKSWTQEEGQLFLTTVAGGNGLHRIIDVLNWPQVSVKAGSNREVLSFQRGLLPLLRYMSSEFVVKSTLRTKSNALFMTILENIEAFADSIETCIDNAIAAKSFVDRALSSTTNKQIVSQIFASLSSVLHECLTRFKNAVSLYPRLGPLVLKYRDWLETWIQGISATPAAFDDPFEDFSLPARDLLINTLKERTAHIVRIVEREQGKVNQSKQPEETKSTTAKFGSQEGILAALQSHYDGPGELRTDGKRHDNDFVDIYDIRVAPTHEELTCRLPPYLPANIYGAPHPAPTESMQRLLDIQFRLLREELTAPLRMSVQLVHQDLGTLRRDKTRLGEILNKGGGKYRGFADGQDGVMFNVYTNVNFVSLVPDHRGLSTSLTVQPPPGRARSAQSRDRSAYWEGMSGKRLMQGGLIALVWQSAAGIAVHLGVIANNSKEVAEFVRIHRDQVKLRVAFFDPKVELRILQTIKHPHHHYDDVKILIESPVMFEAIRPFLEALKVEPELIPFPQYLVHRAPNYFNAITIQPPKYSLIPGFSYELSSLFPPEAEVDGLSLVVTDPASVRHARSELKRCSCLDPSQADSIVNALTRELALIQGPPGTGKSYTGVQLLRVLKQSGVGPILMIAFTNHALDHLLCSVLDTGITTKLVRLGRTADERIFQYSIENLEMVAGKSRMNRTFGGQYRALKDVEEQIKKLMNKIVKIELESESEEITKYLGTFHPEHHEYLAYPPQWITFVRTKFNNDEADGEWFVQGRKGQQVAIDKSAYAYWKNASDLDFLAALQQSSARLPPSPSLPERTNKYDVLEIDNLDIGSEERIPPLEADTDSDEDSDEDIIEERWKKVVMAEVTLEESEDSKPSTSSIQHIEIEPSHSITVALAQTPTSIQPSDIQDISGFFSAIGCEGVPVIPLSHRPLADLIDCGDVWAMSQIERQQLHTFWLEEVRKEVYENQLEEFERLRQKHAEAMKTYNEGKEEERRQLLKHVDIIGCTTTGAAKLESLLKGLSPRVLLVEEAGQVMEAHILGSLAPSVEHLILIGDPLQLRPTLNNYSLSVDNRRGAALYRFDMSLMERLSTAGLPMSQIDVQRRMRPTISSLIRNTLYPKLEDHDLVKQYPPVRGITKNVFFLTHNHKENSGAEDSASKYNIYEVNMIKDLVLYLLRQGCYSQDGDIVVLCTYLGQLARMRDALSNEVAVIIDERDQAALADQESDNETTGRDDAFKVEHVKVSRKVRLRTVDNYQGEEATIVILSLVRNSGTLDDEMEVGMRHGTTGSIGFLKSPNRTNVALSRAREGLYIFGNATNLSSRSQMWRDVIKELEECDAVGDALPVSCYRHPNVVEHVSEPGRLRQIAPDGGCMEPCDAALKCGHLCPYKCHPDDPKHIAITCVRACNRLCSRGHPCQKECANPCGDCIFPIYDVYLPCGHVKSSVPCYQMDSLDEVYCSYKMKKQLPTCEHIKEMYCSEDPAQQKCMAPCGGILACCGRTCKSYCYECQARNSDGKRSNHFPHPCTNNLYCEHSCKESCSQQHEHTKLCKEPCRQVCPHTRCRKPCHMPCAPCQEPCTWACSHYRCPVPCGSVCARLPCDKRCEEQLRCGHQCPSVCGEVCSVQVCPQCAPENTRRNIVDFVMQRSLDEVAPDEETLDEMLITLPDCRHVFTVETLDGHCELSNYYRQDPNNKWVGLEAPPSGFKKPPTCPTCRTAITSPRYGRVFKRADLDILEMNVASQMSQSLEDVLSSISLLSQDRMKDIVTREAAAVEIKNHKSPYPLKTLAKARKDAWKHNRDLVPVSERTINPANNNLHDIASPVLSAWTKATHHLFTAYRKAFQVAETRSAHLHAWEAAYSCLYNQERDRFMENPARAPRRPEEHAMRIATMSVGQPRPLADMRFLVEAFWATLQIRFSLINLAQIWIEVASKSQTYPAQQQLSWATWIEYLLHSCLRDVNVALNVALKSQSHRQVTKTRLFSMRVELEHFRFNLFMCRKNGTLKVDRQNMIEKVALCSQNATNYMTETLQIHRQHNRWSEDWLAENFSSTARAIVEEWVVIERTLRMDTFYEPVSLQEKMDIVNALTFGHAGHFYNCRNGHTFVITECGGAMERSRCPECGDVIGGANHRLVEGNSRATEFEEMARQRGAQRNPWG